MSDDHELSAIDPAFDFSEFPAPGVAMSGSSAGATPPDRDPSWSLPASAVLEATRATRAICWARLAPGGIVIDANRGFAELLGLSATFGAEIGARFVAPPLTELEGFAGDRFARSLIVSVAGGRRITIEATLHRVGRQLLLVGESVAGGPGESTRSSASGRRQPVPVRE